MEQIARRVQQRYSTRRLALVNNGVVVQTARGLRLVIVESSQPRLRLRNDNQKQNFDALTGAEFGVAARTKKRGKVAISFLLRWRFYQT
jgi:hypothetical protein